jgi:hypothetical protein
MDDKIQVLDISKPVVKLVFHFSDGQTNVVQSPVSVILIALEKHLKFEFESACKATFQ